MINLKRLSASGGSGSGASGSGGAGGAAGGSGGGSGGQGGDEGKGDPRNVLGGRVSIRDRLLAVEVQARKEGRHICKGQIW